MLRPSFAGTPAAQTTRPRARKPPLLAWPTLPLGHVSQRSYQNCTQSDIDKTNTLQHSLPTYTTDEEEEEEEEEEGLFRANAVNEEDPERPRYPGVGDETRRTTTLLRETHPYPS